MHVYSRHVVISVPKSLDYIICNLNFRINIQKRFLARIRYTVTLIIATNCQP